MGPKADLGGYCLQLVETAISQAGYLAISIRANSSRMSGLSKNYFKHETIGRLRPEGSLEVSLS